MESTPYPLGYRVRGYRNGALVVDSTDVLRVDVSDAAPQLWFPRGDLVEESVVAEEGTDALCGRVSFDHEQVHLEMIDSRDGDDPRDVTTKRFPNWGDAADLVEVIDVKPDGDARYVSVARSDWRRPVVEGSQQLGQVIVAASRRAPDRRVVSASLHFIRPSDARASYDIEVDEVTNGRTFTALRAAALQGGKTCAFGSVLLDVTAPDVIRHADTAPDGPGPYDAVPFDMGVTGRDLRVVDGAYTGDPDAPLGPPELDAWVRFRELPDDEPVHAGLLAQFTGHMSIAAALRPHAGIGQNQAHRTLSTAVNAISLSLHAPIRADQWMLYRHRSTFAGNGMTHSVCGVYNEDGAPLASFTVEAMVRAFDDPTKSVDERTTL